MRHPRALAAYLDLGRIVAGNRYPLPLRGRPCGPAGSVLVGCTCLAESRNAGAQVLGATMIAAVVGGALLASFYLPYVIHPRFEATLHYLTDRRIGGSPPYNNLDDVFLRTTLYSTTYYVLLAIGLTLLGMIRIYFRGMRACSGLAGQSGSCRRLRHDFVESSLADAWRPRLDHRTVHYSLCAHHLHTKAGHRRTHAVALVWRSHGAGYLSHRKAAHSRLYVLYALAVDRGTGTCGSAGSGCAVGSDLVQQRPSA